MTPKETAEDLISTFRYASKDGELITPKEASLEYVKIKLKFRNLIYKGTDIQYWEEVKKEIEAL
jgi:hypothetical protein